MYYGRHAVGGFVSFMFTTRASTGIPTVLAGTPVVTVHRETSTTGELTSASVGITLTVDFDSIVGLNQVFIDTEQNATFFLEDSMFHITITTGTVDGVSVVGEHVGSFDLEPIDAIRAIPQSAGVNVPPKDSPNGFVITTGETEANTENSVHVPDGTTHDIEAALDGTQKIEVYYEFASSTTALPSMYTVRHHLDGSQSGGTQTLIVSAWNFTDSAWQQIGELSSRFGMQYNQYALLAEHIEVGVGTVRIQYKTGVGTFQIDTKLEVDHAYLTYVDSQVTADVTSISGDSTAADNLELMYDTTGYNDGTAPASRDQVDALGGSVGSGAVNVEASEDNSGGTIDPGSTAFVGNETNNYTDTALANGVYHVITDDTGDIDVVYGFNVSGNSQATLLEFNGFANANNDDLTVQAWNHVSPGWETIGTLEGKAATTNENLSLSLLGRHTGTSVAEIGKVYIRFVGTSLSVNADLNTDQIIVGAVSSASATVTPGYAVGSIWVDTNGSNSNAVAYVDGLADNPVNSWANALSVSSATSITDFHIMNGSSIQLSANSDNFSLFGDNWALDLNGQSVVGIHVEGANVSGVMAGTGTDQTFDHCHMGVTSLIKSCHFIDCAIEATQTVVEAGDFFYESCSSGVAGNDTWTFEFGNSIGNTNLNLRNYSGGIQLESMGDTGTDTASIEGQGQIIEGTCAGGTVAVRGAFTTSGITNITLTDGALLNMTNINEECDAAIVTYGLDHLLTASVTGSDITDNSILARIASKSSTADWDSFNNTTDSLEALRDFFSASITPEIISGASSTLQTGTYIAGAVEDVRRYTDEPSVNAKWKDADILVKLNEAWAEIYVDVTFNSRWPVLVRYNLSISTDVDYVMLPPNVGSIVQIAKISDDDSRRIVWELDTRDTFDVRGWGVRITGNTLELGANWQGSAETLELMYIPNGVIAPLDGVWSSSEDFSTDLKTVILATTATNGNLPTLPNCLAGYMFRTIPAKGTAPVADDPTTIQQEHLITAYNPVTRVVTLATDQNPAITLGGGDEVVYEIVPILHSLLRGIVAVRAAQNILSAEGNKDRAGMLALEYRRKIRSLKLQLASVDGRHATQFEGGTRDDPRARRNWWGF